MIVDPPTCQICLRWAFDMTPEETEALMNEWYDDSMECISCLGMNRDPIPLAEVMVVKRHSVQRRVELAGKFPWQKHIAAMNKMLEK